MNRFPPLPCPATMAGESRTPHWQRLCHRLMAELPPTRYGQIPLVLAVSGGADSVALARLLHDCWQQSPAANPRLITLAHFNHQLRGDDSDGDQRFVAQLADQLGVAHVSTTAASETAASETAASELPGSGSAVESTSGNEAVWRRQRYAFFLRVLQQTGSRCLLTAHQADDQVETLLQRLFRGSGPAGLCGIPRRRPLGSDFMVYRPLLGFTGEELRRGLSELGQLWREDHSNALPDHDRNWVRNQLLPLIRQRYPQADQAIVRLIAGQNQWQQSVQQQAESWIEQRVVVGGGVDAGVLWIRQSAVSPAVTAAAIARLWDRLGWPRQSLDAAHYGQLHRRLSGESGGGADGGADGGGGTSELAAALMLPGDVQCRRLAEWEADRVGPLASLPRGSVWWQLRRLRR